MQKFKSREFLDTLDVTVFRNILGEKPMSTGVVSRNPVTGLSKRHVMTRMKEDLEMLLTNMRDQPYPPEIDAKLKMIQEAAGGEIIELSIVDGKLTSDTLMPFVHQVSHALEYLRWEPLKKCLENDFE